MKMNILKARPMFNHNICRCIYKARHAFIMTFLFMTAICLFSASVCAQNSSPQTQQKTSITPQQAAPQAGGAPDIAQENASSDAMQDSIIAVVNSMPLTTRDVNNRGRLFVLSIGLPVSDELMQRLRPQIIRQMIDEKLRTQEILRRRINIPPEQIALTIKNIEQRNGMPPGSLQKNLNHDKISISTLIDQLRVQIGWIYVLKMELGPRARVSVNDIAHRQAALKRENGRTEYQISEIFIKVDDPRHAEEERNFTETIVDQLRKGAPFPIVAAQFSQSQTALDGGSMGWVQDDMLDDSVIQIVKDMPPNIGAISDPITVPGGFVIVTLNNKRIIGQEMGHMLTLRQLFLPFSTSLDPNHITHQQEQTLQKAISYIRNVHDCHVMEKLNKDMGEKRPTDPGELPLERLNPQMQAVLAPLPVNQISRPLVSHEGIDLLMICTKKEKNFSNRTPSEIADQIMNERVEQAARQIDSDLHRRAMIDLRTHIKGI